MWLFIFLLILALVFFGWSGFLIVLLSIVGWIALCLAGMGLALLVFWVLFGR